MKRILIPFVVVFSVVYNIPKYFELKTVIDAETNLTVVEGTDLRLNKVYTTVYIFW